MNTTYNVSIAEIKVMNAPAILSCLGLGSCVGVVLYDPKKKVGGLAHIMLPDSRIAKETSNLAKFADTAIDFMINEMIEKGAQKEKIQAKIFGGANMFPELTSQPQLLIGERNIKAVREKLRYHSIPLLAKDIGGNVGRTIYFEVTTGMVVVRMLKMKGEKIY